MDSGYGMVASRWAPVEDPVTVKPPGVLLDPIDFLGYALLMFIFGRLFFNIIRIDTDLNVSIGVRSALVLSSGYLLT